MTDEASDLAQQEWLSRLGETMSWMLFPGRRPGFLGTALAIRGHIGDGKPAELRRAESGWTFLVEGQPPVHYEESGHSLEVIPNYRFMPETVIVVPRIAHLLFQGAVEQAERGLNEYWESLAITVRSNIDEVGKFFKPAFLDMILKVPLSNPVDFSLATSLLDRSLRSSIASIGLAISCAEAQVNDWADRVGGWQAGEDNEPVVRKFRLVAKKLSIELDIGASPFQEMQSHATFRHELVHPKPIEQELGLNVSRSPGRDLSVQARRTCWAVRRCLIEVSDKLGFSRPRYLNYCPAGDPEDDEAWKNAVVMTGVRPDPDFPSASESAESPS
jgi:hypothetical protein